MLKQPVTDKERVDFLGCILAALCLREGGEITLSRAELRKACNGLLDMRISDTELRLAAVEAPKDSKWRPDRRRTT